MGVQTDTTSMGTHEYLMLQFPGLEHKLRKRSKVKVEEQNICYKLEGVGVCKNIDYTVDGVLIPATKEGERKCDSLLLVKLADGHWVRVFIELKATDVEHGLKQLVETVKHDLFKSCGKGEKQVARLVIKRMPSSQNNPTVERFRDILARLNCPLKTLKPGQPESFNGLMGGH